MKKFVLPIWLFTYLLYIAVTEITNSTDIVAWVYIAFLVLFLLGLGYKYTYNRKYIPLLFISLGFGFSILSVPLLFTFENFSRLSGPERFVYFFYSVFTIFFLLICMLINLLLYVVKNHKGGEKGGEK